jgi:hypothetical protein
MKWTLMILSLFVRLEGVLLTNNPVKIKFLLRRLFLLKLFVEEDLENEEEDQNYLDHLNNLNNLFWVFLSSCNWLKW